MIKWKNKQIHNKIAAAFFLCALFQSCTLEPKYKTPKTDLPFKWEDQTKPKISTIPWQQYYLSRDLQRVIQIALDNNRDLRVANLNIELARENYGVARSNLLPTINATASETKQGVPAAFASFTPRKQFRANLSIASYELDFFGRLRSLKKSALENFLATREARNITRISLISEVVNSYAQLLADQETLQVLNQYLTAQQRQFSFNELRYKFGVDSQLDLLSAQSLLENARIMHENYIKIVEQDKNALFLLMGTFDEKLLPQNLAIDDIEIVEDVLDLAPSEMLLTRPDIQSAEHVLKSANANIGAARAAFFPSITLTTSAGYASRQLNTLTSSKVWSFSPQINLPIFTGGRNLSELEIANIQKKVEIANYEKAIQTAFREVQDKLAEKKSITNQLNSYEEVLKINKRFYEVAIARSKEGLSSGPDVVISELSWLLAKQNKIAAKKEYIANLVGLYKALGGGSEIESDGDEL